MPQQLSVLLRTENPYLWNCHYITYLQFFTYNRVWGIIKMLG